MDNTRIQELLAKQEFKCSRCGASLLDASICPLENEIVCPLCFDEGQKDFGNSSEIVQVSEKSSKRQKKKEEKAKTEKKTKNNSCIISLESEKSSPPVEPPKDVNKEIREWAVRLSHEEECGEIKYLLQNSWIRLWKRLAETQGNKIKVVGAQGCGKSTFAYVLNRWLNDGKRNSSILLTPEQKGESPLGHKESEKRYEEIEAPEGKGDGLSGYKQVMTTVSYWEWENESYDNHLLDLWDFSKTGSGAVKKALDDIQAFWRMKCRKRKWAVEQLRKGFKTDSRGYPIEIPVIPNIVIFLQKESIPLHFFLGKCEYFKLETWSTENLTGYLKYAFGSNGAFTEKALAEIAALSRGIFRKFKEYVATCLDSFFIEKLEKITIEDVKRLITSERITRDSALSLSELFPRSHEHRETAIQIEAYLRENGTVFQETIIDRFFLGDSVTCSRVLKTLSIYGRIKGEKVGRKRRWRIA